MAAPGSIAAQADGTALTLARLQGIAFVGPDRNALTSVQSQNLLRFDPVGLSTTASVVGDVAPIPLPGALPLLVAGLGGFAALRRRRAA